MKRFSIGFGSLPVMLLLPFALLLCQGCKPEHEAKVKSPAASTKTEEPKTVAENPVSTPVLDEDVILLLSNEVIVYDHLRRYMDPRKAIMMAQMAGREDLRPYLVENLKDKAIDPLVEQWLLLQEARRLHLEVSPEEVDDLLLRTKSLFTEEQFKERMDLMNAGGYSLDQLFTNQILIAKMQKYRDQEFVKEITPETKREWYEQHIESHFSPPATTDLRRVCLLYGEKRTPDEASQELRELLTEVQKKFETVTDETGRVEIMMDMAYNRSETPDAQYSHGLHNIIHVAKAWPYIGKEYSDITRQAPVGVLSDIVPIPSGYAFFYVTQQTPLFVHPFENPTVQRLLPNFIVGEKRDQWRQQKREEYNVKYFQDHLEACVDRDLDLAMSEAENQRMAVDPQAQSSSGMAGQPAPGPMSVATPSGVSAPDTKLSGEGT
ncbi:MAG: SurA N-terminal domain-containing protein [bacterium]